MAAGLQKPSEPITAINVTPLVDVMLVLLIIFMVTANYIHQQSIKVELPKAATGQVNDGITNLGFTIDAHSTLYLDGEVVQLEGLAAILAAKRADSPKLQALIHGDVKASYGAVVALIDTLRREGIHDYALNIEVQP